jgi:hypothetical protein
MLMTSERRPTTRILLARIAIAERQLGARDQRFDGVLPCGRETGHALRFDLAGRDGLLSMRSRCSARADTERWSGGVQLDSIAWCQGLGRRVVRSDANDGTPLTF